MYKKSFIALLLLALLACANCTHEEAIEELMDNASDPTHVDHQAGLTEDDIMNAHMDEHEDAIGIADINSELKELKDRIKEFSENPEELSEDEKEHLINRAKLLEELNEKNEQFHEQINEIMQGLANLKAEFKDEEENDL
jgi:DNA repair exonuclease SbcCD ATPase subunit